MQINSFIVRDVYCRKSGVSRQPLVIESSLIFRGFVFRSFSASRGRPKNKNTQHGPFSGSEHQSCSTRRTGLWATPQVRDERKEEHPIHNVCTKKRNPLKKIKTFLGGGAFNYSRIFALRGGLET